MARYSQVFQGIGAPVLLSEDTGGSAEIDHQAPICRRAQEKGERNGGLDYGVEKSEKADGGPLKRIGTESFIG